MKQILTNTLLMIMILTILTSCNRKRIENSKTVTFEFFDAIKNGNEVRMTELYPNFKKIGTHYKSDEISIKGTKSLVIEDKKIIVTVDNSYTNGFGKKFNQTISLYLEPLDDKGNKYRIYDSKGLTSYEDDDIYAFAHKIGCIKNDKDLTDQEISEMLTESSQILVDMSLDVISKLREQVSVSSWSWESGYGGSVSGRGIVKNNSEFSVPNLKYKIIYYDRNDLQITSDDGYVTIDMLVAGSSKSFTFYTSYVGSATTATIALDFDTELVLNYILAKDYNGTECEEYRNKKKSEVIE